MTAPLESCTGCSGSIAPGDRFCASCGALAPAAALPPVCLGCSEAVELGDHFCGGCGRPVAAATAAPAVPPLGADWQSRIKPIEQSPQGEAGWRRARGHDEEEKEAACLHCGAAIIPDDQFCSICGKPPRLMTPASAAASAAATGTMPVSAGQFPADMLLAIRRSFCRACGVDHDASQPACLACGVDCAPLPARIEGSLGLVYVFRRALRKRAAVRLADENGAARLMFESGEITHVDLAEMPEPAESPIADGALPAARTPPGSLLRLAQACSRQVIKHKWNPESLVAVALENVLDVTTARLFALDATDLSRTELIDQLPLTASERSWLSAVRNASIEDFGAVVGAVAKLPAARYRPKLALLALTAQAAAAGGVDLRPAKDQLEPFLDEEPLASLMYRGFGLADDRAGQASSDELAVAVATDQQLLHRGLLPARLADEIAAGLAAVDGATPLVPERLRHAPANVRVLLARSDPRPGIVRTEDVDAVPTPLIDDLVASGALAPEDAVAGAKDPARSLYVRARFAPALLTDREVQQLEHGDERIRRAFRYGTLETVDDLADTATLRHYRALQAVRRARAGDVVVDDVFAFARPTVEDLLELIAAKREGLPMSERLTETMLADPTVWPALVEIAGSTSLDPTPELQSRFGAFTEWLALHQAREHLFVADWRAAVVAADRCLALARAEPVRDEALNLKACGLHYLGQDDQAIAALEEAIEGAYSDSLLANIGIVAAGLRPEVAARHLGVLIAEAPTIALRVAAARRALSIWSASDTASWRNSDESPLPDVFQDALRDLVVADLEIDDFREFASLLAVHDSKWFGSAKNLGSSPHRSSLEARFYVARAGNHIEMVEIMGLSIVAGSPPEWVIFERDSLRSAAVDILFDQLDEPDSAFGFVALAMVDNDVLADAYDGVLLHALGVASATYHLSQRQTEVADAIVQRVRDIRTAWAVLEAEDRERLEHVVELATRRVAVNRMNARDREMSEAIDLFNGAIQLGKYAEVGSPAYREAMRRIAFAVDVARKARADLLPWPPLLDHEVVVAGLNASLEQTRELEQRCMDILN